MKAMTAIVLGLSALISSAHAAPVDKEPRGHDCLFASQPDNWHVLDRQHLVLWGSSQKEAYLLTLFAPLQDLNFAETLAFIDTDHDGMICDGDKIAVAHSGMNRFPATISSMRKVSQAELVTLGEQYKVKLLSDKKIQQIKDHDKQIPATPAPATRD
jgi:hypothetical protein